MRTPGPASTGSMNLGQQSHEICGSIHRVEFSQLTVIEVKAATQWHGLSPLQSSSILTWEEVYSGTQWVVLGRGMCKNIICQPQSHLQEYFRRPALVLMRSYVSQNPIPSVISVCLFVAHQKRWNFSWDLSSSVTHFFSLETLHNILTPQEMLRF